MMLTLVIGLGVGYPVLAMSEGPPTAPQDMFLITGEILEIEGNSYTVEDGNGREYRIVMDQNTQVPKPVQTGDMVHVEVGADNHARSMNRFGLFQFDMEFERRLQKTREQWVKKEDKAVVDELRKASLLLKAEALRADKEVTELWKAQGEFEHLANEIRNGVPHALIDVEAAFNRAKAVLAKRVHERTLR